MSTIVHMHYKLRFPARGVCRRKK